MPATRSVQPYAATVALLLYLDAADGLRGGPVESTPQMLLVAADGLGHLVLVVAERLLELLDQGDVPRLGLLGGDALVDDLLPCVLLGLALFCGALLFTWSGGWLGSGGDRGGLP